MARNQPGSTDQHALRLIQQGRIVCDPATGVVLVDGEPRGISDRTSGYQQIYAAGVRMQAHRVVWMFVHGPIKSGHVVNHRDGNRRNNRIGNLEAITQQQNLQHAHRSPNYRGQYPGEPPIETFADPVAEDVDWLMQTVDGFTSARAHKIA